MNNLTALEIKVLNNVSQCLNPTVVLGDKIQEIIGCVGAMGTPVNAVSATEILTISGVSSHGETITIGSDVYEFLADDAQTKTDPTNLSINIVDYTSKASGILTMDTQPTAGDTLTIGTKTYIFVPVGTANSIGEISIGDDLATAQSSCVAAINGTDGFNSAHPLVSIEDFTDNTSSITAFIGGIDGNSIVTTETFTATTNVFSDSTLDAGTNCTDINTVTAIVASIVAYDTQGVTGVKGEGNTIVLTADVAGVIGNYIIIGETMANGSFTDGAVELSGGVDGTVASGMKIMVDNTYMYICINGNTTAEKKWRRISLGDAY